jgi:hypothetical protein
LFPSRLTKIDELTRGDHSYLEAGDECLFFGEYSARKGFSHSETNQLILNFKKPIDRKEKPEWQHKMNAIGTVATAFSLNIDNKFALLTLVPVRPSKMNPIPYMMIE